MILTGFSGMVYAENEQLQIEKESEYEIVLEENEKINSKPIPKETREERLNRILNNRNTESLTPGSVNSYLSQSRISPLESIMKG